MEPVGSAARRLTRAAVASLSPNDRIELAFALAEDDLRIFMAVNSLDRAGALARLRLARHHGRRRSVAGSADGVL